MVCSPSASYALVLLDAQREQHLIVVIPNALQFAGAHAIVFVDSRDCPQIQTPRVVLATQNMKCPASIADRTFGLVVLHGGAGWDAAANSQPDPLSHHVSSSDAGGLGW